MSRDYRKEELIKFEDSVSCESYYSRGTEDVFRK